LLIISVKRGQAVGEVFGAELQRFGVILIAHLRLAIDQNAGDGATGQRFGSA
jgi:hypothetical protein